MSYTMTVTCRCPCMPGACHSSSCIIADLSPPKPVDHDKDIGKPSRWSENTDGSSVYSLRSSPTEASSPSARLTLVEQEMRWEVASGLGISGVDSMSHSDKASAPALVPKPLRVRNCSQANLQVPEPQPPSYSQLVDKPLPPYPTGIVTPVEDTSRPRTASQNGPSNQSRLRCTLPTKPSACDLALLNRLLAKTGQTYSAQPKAEDRPPKQLRQIPRIETNFDHLSNQDRSATVPLLNNGYGKLNGSRAWLSNERTEEKNSDLKPDPPAPGRVRRYSNSIVQTFQKIWPSALSPRSPPRPRSRRTFHASPRSAGPSPINTSPSSASSVGKRPPPSPTTRMKRVLSALMEERVSIDLTAVTKSDEIDQLLQRTRRLLIDGLPPLADSKEVSEEDPPVGDEDPEKLASEFLTFRRKTMHELDGRPTSRFRPPIKKPKVPILEQVMYCVDELSDLFSLALVNRETYTVFKLNELGFIKRTLRRCSPPAWELREITEVPYNPQSPAGCQALAASLYIRHHTRDVCHLAAIKFLLENHCRPLFSQPVLDGLRNPHSPEAAEVDAAIWRVFTFCHLFGNRKEREEDIHGQRLWLLGERLSVEADLPPICRTMPEPADFNTVLFNPPSGFAQGNAGGLSRRQLLNMVDIWIAMGTLLDFLRQETERARRYGLFDEVYPRIQTPKQEVRALRSWLDFIPTLGPAAVLELAPLGPRSDPDVAFARASSNGWTNWSPPSAGSPRSTFLIGAVRSVLRDMPNGGYRKGEKSSVAGSMGRQARI
ncbi:hypothetical protein BDV19DRAFT_352123 [Aspergillus venezuelensis]